MHPANLSRKRGFTLSIATLSYDQPAGKLRGWLSPRFLPTYDVWFGWAYLRMFLFAFAVIFSLIVLIDNLENFDKFVNFAEKNQHTTWQMVGILIGHYAAFAPSLMCQFLVAVVPMAAAAIVATQACLRREMTLLNASGISLTRAVAPLIMLALAFGVIYFLTRDSFVPRLLRKSFVMSNQLRPADIKPLNEVVRFGDQQQHVLIGYYEAHDGAAYNISIEMRSLADYAANQNNFTLYQARRAFLQDYVNVDSNDNQFVDKQWTPDPDAPAVVKVHRNGRFVSTAPWTESLPTIVRPARLERQVLTDMVMTWSDLLRSSEELDIKLEMSRRLAEPFAAAAILLVILPLILRAAAHGEPASYINNAIVCIFAYGGFFVLNSLFFSLGEKGALSPFIASQLANVLYAGAGAALFWRLEK